MWIFPERHMTSIILDLSSKISILVFFFSSITSPFLCNNWLLKQIKLPPKSSNNCGYGQNWCRGMILDGDSVLPHGRGERGRSLTQQRQQNPAGGRLLTAASEGLCLWERSGEESCPSARWSFTSVIVLIWPWRHLMLLECTWSLFVTRCSACTISLSHTCWHRQTHWSLNLLTASGEENGRRWEDHNSGIDNK